VQLLRRNPFVVILRDLPMSATHTPHMQYRPEIDGLRSLAVLPVILSHAGFKAFHGGFVGVDVFFVISGFLITSILLAETSQGRFSLLTFYERRARRILPALFVVMAACLPVAYWGMLPNEFKNFGQSLVATSLFANNVLLMLTSGYWSLASEFKPLLHTWSLGVEEQFYILFPLMLMACRRWRGAALMSLFASLALLSLASAEWGSRAWPNAAFYLLPTRAWELLIGSMAAALPLLRLQPVASGGVRQALSLSGLVMIVGSVLTFDESVPSPSLFILLPTLGATLIILFATPGTWVQRLLASKVPVTIGLISYSAYLWHQPLFAFARILSVDAPGAGLMLGLSALTLVLAYLSWRFVEAPFRAKGRVRRAVVFGGAFVGSLCFVIVGGYVQLRQGMPERVFDTSVAQQPGMYISYNERIFRYSANSFVNAVARKVLVQGNSYARDFVNMNLEVFDTKGLEFVYRNDFPECFSELEAEMRRLYEQAAVIVYASGDPKVRCVQEDIAQARRDGKEIFYLGSKHFGYNLNWLARRSDSERVLLGNPVMAVYEAEERALRQRVPFAHYLPIYEHVLLPSGLMPVTDAKARLLTPDRGHLTRAGAVYLGQRVLWGSSYERALNNPPRVIED